MNSEGVDVMNGEEQVDQQMVPKLRFPEFRDAGAWPFKPLHSMAKRKTRRNADEAIIRVLTNSAEHGVVDQKDYFEKDIAVQGNLGSYFVVEAGDFVYNPRISSRAPVGPIGKNKVGTGVMSPLYTVFSFEAEDDGFYEHFFRSARWHAYMRLASNSGARHDRMAISNDDFMAMPVPSPSAGEQQKVADCLSSLDEVIAAEGERLAAMREYKRGLMQQLFPRPERMENGQKVTAETTPRLRFPEFLNAAQWEEHSIGDSSTSFSGGTPTTSNEKFYGGDIPFIRSAEIDATETEIHLTDEGLSNSSAKSVTAGDVLIAMYGANSANAAISKISGAINQAILCVRHRTNNEYLYQFWNSRQDWVIQRYLQGGQGNLSADIIKSIRISTPKNQKEQQKIATCLGTMDSAIELQVSKLQALKDHKVGLMQQLFPSPEETHA